MTDFTLPPPDATGAPSPGGPAGKSRKKETSPTDQPSSPQDRTEISELLGKKIRWARTDRAVNKTLHQMQSIGHEDHPFPEKLARMTGVFDQAVMPLTLKGDDRALSHLRNGAGEILEKLVNEEISRIKEAPNLSGSEKLLQLQQMQQQVEEVPWLAEGFKSSIRVDLAFAQADLRFQR